MIFLDFLIWFQILFSNEARETFQFQKCPKNVKRLLLMLDQKIVQSTFIIHFSKRPFGIIVTIEALEFTACFALDDVQFQERAFNSLMKKSLCVIHWKRIQDFFSRKKIPSICLSLCVLSV